MGKPKGGKVTKQEIVVHVAAVLQVRRDVAANAAALKAFKDLMTERDSAEDRVAFDVQFFDALRSWSRPRVGGGLVNRL